MIGRPVIVHSLAQARAALAVAAELGVPVTLASAPGAAGYAGVAWFGELVAAAAGPCPEAKLTAVLDCGDAPGRVMEAVRWCAGAGRARPRLVLRFAGEPELVKPLGEIAAAARLELVRELEPALDLGTVADPEAACRAWLAVAP